MCKVNRQKDLNARLLLGGDQQHIAHTAFASAPKADRYFMRLSVVFLMGDVRRRLGLADISETFAQWGYRSAEERMSDWEPVYIGFIHESWQVPFSVDRKGKRWRLMIFTEWAHRKFLAGRDDSVYYIALCMDRGAPLTVGG